MGGLLRALKPLRVDRKTLLVWALKRLFKGDWRRLHRFINSIADFSTLFALVNYAAVANISDIVIVFGCRNLTEVRWETQPRLFSLRRLYAL